MLGIAIDAKITFWKAEDFIRSFLQNGEVEVALKSPMLTTNLLNVVAHIAEGNTSRDSLSVTLCGEYTNPPAYIKSANDFLSKLSSNQTNFKLIHQTNENDNGFSVVIKLNKGLSGVEDRLRMSLVDQTEGKVASSDIYKSLEHDLYVAHFTKSHGKEQVYQIFMKPLDMDTTLLP